MKQKSQYTNAEKIAIFDSVHDSAKDEFNEAALNPDRDEHYFWEDMMAQLLDIGSADWTLHNNGHQF